MKVRKTTPAVRVVKLSKTVGPGDDAVEALRDVSFSVQPGELLVVKGSPGPGVMALMNCVAGLEEPDSGSVFIGDRELTAMRESDRVTLRQTNVGVLFGSLGLIPILTVAENVEVPMRLVGMPPSERRGRVEELLELVGLTEHHDQRPATLSDDQQRCVTLARALANRPKVLVADEPIGQDNSETASSIIDLLNGPVRSHQVAAIVATNNPLLIQRADHVLELLGGPILGAGTGSLSSVPAPGASPG